MNNLTIIGDSMIANENYIMPGEDTTGDHIRRAFMDHSVTNHSFDGAMIYDALKIADTIPVDDMDRVVVCVGGNDGLAALGRIEPLIDGSALDFLSVFMVEVDSMVRSYSVLLHRLRGANHIVCLGPYNPQPGNHDPILSDPRIQLLVEIWTGAMRTVAENFGASYVDLRRVVFENDHYANAIEPSSRGGSRIATAIRRNLS